MRIPSLVVACLLSVCITACESHKKQIPAPTVGVAKPTRRTIVEYLYFTGNAAASNSVKLEARVTGYLRSVGFKDGDIVKKDSLLFVVEPEPYEAKVRQMEGALQAAQAQLNRAEIELNRQLDMLKKNATSQSEADRWRASRDEAKGNLDGAQANYDLAKIDYGYTQITAPFDGRLDRRLYDPGALVGVGGASELTTINQLNPIYAYFNINERDLVSLLKKNREGPTYKDTDVLFELAIEGEKAPSHPGKLDYSASTLDAATGTLQLRAVFDNPMSGERHLILPGMYVRLRAPSEKVENAVLVPDKIISFDQIGRYVLLVNEQGVVEQRYIDIGWVEDDGMRYVSKGLSGDENIIVDGLMLARPGIKVTVQPSGQQAAPSSPKPPETSPGSEKK